jgi:hypothetical protein
MLWPAEDVMTKESGIVVPASGLLYLGLQQAW